LCTDGDFNVGVTNETELARLVASKAQLGVSLTVLGFGMSRDDTLELLAEKGGGNYGYIDSRREANKLLVQQVDSALVNVASDVKVHVDFNPARVASYRLIGYEDGFGASPNAGAEAVESADLGAGDEVTALYEVVPTAAATGNAELLTLGVEYKDLATGDMRHLDAALSDGGDKFASASTDFKFAAAVAEFGMVLRDSPYRGQASMRDVIAWATAGAGRDALGCRRDFIDLARRTETLLQ
jgi:Ca-activated chloride channel family protein